MGRVCNRKQPSPMNLVSIKIGKYHRMAIPGFINFQSYGSSSPESFYLRPMRMILLTLILVLLSTSRLPAQIENDKIAHFAVGTLAGAGGAFIASELTNRNRFWTVTGSITASLLAGLAKEALDVQNSNSWDNADLGATVLGGVTVGIAIELFSKKEGKNYRSRNKKTGASQVSTSTAEFLKLDAEINLLRSGKSDLNE